MKPTILLTLFLGCFSLTGFSQDKQHDIATDSLSNALAIKPLQFNMKPLELKGNQSTQLFNYDKPHGIPGLEAIKGYSIQDSPALTEEHTIYRMPCVIPELNNHMPVVKPDSTLQYSLKIKELK